VLEKSANNSTVSVAGNTGVVASKPSLDDGLTRCIRVLWSPNVCCRIVIPLVSSRRRLLSRGSLGWSEGFRDEDGFEGNAASYAARNVSPALSAALTSPELRRSPIMTPRSSSINVGGGGGERPFTLGDGGKSPKHAVSPKHTSSPKSMNAALRPPSNVGMRGFDSSPEQRDTVFQSSSVSALSAFPVTS
jgi:hypothetical protein